MRFANVKLPDGSFATRNVCSFTLSPTNVAYANTLRRLIMTGVEMVAFRADMTDKGTTTDVKVLKNDTPMTNEMLAHRIGLLPIHVRKPLEWNSDAYTFRLKATAEKDTIRDVTCADFEIRRVTATGDEVVETALFFPPHPITKSTCLIATLTPGNGAIDIEAKATLGTGRENARFQPINRCTYTYTRDKDAGRLNEYFTRWLRESKMVTETEGMSKDAEPLRSLLQEFNTMEVNRVYLVDEKGEPYSFDFVVKSIGTLDVTYIVQRACDVGEAMVARYTNIDTADLAELPEVTVSAADSRILGFDFLFRGHDHTLGNLLQTWLTENHVDVLAETGKTSVSYAGYVIPHPLRDEMLLRIGVKDGKVETARKALAEACAGCAEMFRQLKLEWNAGIAEAGGKSRMNILREFDYDIRAGAAGAGAGAAGAGARPLRGAAVAKSTAASKKVEAPAPVSGVATALKTLQEQTAALAGTKAT